MNIPDYEMQALYDWSTAELEQIEKDYPYVSGVLDGYGVVAQKAHFAEYNKRLEALHKKYPAPSVVKSQTFGQILRKVAN